MKPLIRWAGSKRALIHRLRPYWANTSTRYIEPFAGSACLFFDIAPETAILGDLNGELIETYRAIANDPALVLEGLARLRPGKTEYYRIRNTDPTTLSSSETAARFLYLNRNCFNGLYRTNRSGRFNVPFGPPRSGAPMATATILAASDLLRKADIICADFEKTISYAERGDFVYMDPPYAIQGRRMFTEYMPGSFKIDDLARLASSLKALNEKGVTFLISYADSKEARTLLSPWKPIRISVHRHIAGFAGARRSSYELLASNISPKTL